MEKFLGFFSLAKMNIKKYALQRDGAFCDAFENCRVCLWKVFPFFLWYYMYVWKVSPFHVSNGLSHCGFNGVATTKAMM
jgi:hypothetical protein